MNIFQKKLNKEAIQLSKDVAIPFKKARKALRFKIKIQYYSPCENYCNVFCSMDEPVKLAWCKDQV